MIFPSNPHVERLYDKMLYLNFHNTYIYDKMLYLNIIYDKIRYI